jgi:beta-phosphoglucomutase-like phosphatase (HAD superfamily)
MYVATSTYHASAAKELEHSDIRGYFDGIIGGDEITKGKPDPEIFIKAAELSGYSKENCLVIEDSTNGLKAGISSGIKTVYIKDIVDVPTEITDKAYAKCEALDGVIDIIKNEV